MKRLSLCFFLFFYFLILVTAHSLRNAPLLVPITRIYSAVSKGAVCLDGSPPAYHLDRGSGSGAHNWILHFEGGGWCGTISKCLHRATTRHGSSWHMDDVLEFTGILGNDPTMNPDFYNWNRVKMRYCDGASFAGESEYKDGETVLYFRGQRIWYAIIHDLLQKGLLHSRKVLLSGCSAGGLTTFIHCDDLSQLLPRAVTVKCLSDGGFFLDVKDIAGDNTIRPFFHDTVTLQGAQKNLNKLCLMSRKDPFECFFPQYVLKYIRTPYFILNPAYDKCQFIHNLVPPSVDPYGHWNACKSDPAACTPYQMNFLQGYRLQMLSAIRSFEGSKAGGTFINSCFAHCQSEFQDTWFAPDSPKLHNKTIAKTVSDWYFGRSIVKEVDCPYPCDPTCHTLETMCEIVE